MRVEWRCLSTTSGGLYVTTSGTVSMPRLFVEVLDCQGKLLHMYLEVSLNVISQNISETTNPCISFLKTSILLESWILVRNYSLQTMNKYTPITTSLVILTSSGNACTPRRYLLHCIWVDISSSKYSLK